MRHDNVLHTIPDSKRPVHNDHCWQANERKRQSEREIERYQLLMMMMMMTTTQRIFMRMCMCLCELLFLSFSFLLTVRVLMALRGECAKKDYLNGNVSITARI